MPKPVAKSPAKSAERQQRLAAALRANLKRRKAQARSLAGASEASEKSVAPGDIGPAPDTLPDTLPDSGPIPAQKGD
jgi:hypothetical protein